MKLQRITQQAVLGLALLCAAAPLVHAQEARVVVDTMPPVLFMNGGIGQSDEAATRAAGKAFNLRLEFSERKDNEFVADADLLISDMQNQPVFALHNAGPIVNVNLPAGKYRVAATFHGQTETQPVVLRGRASEDLYFHWNGSAG